MKDILLPLIGICSILISANETNAQSLTEFANTSLGYTTTTSVNAPAPEAARLADLDGDGDLDAVIANGNFDSGFSVMLNFGYGTFGIPFQYTTGFESWDVVVADFTGDSIPDVAVSNRGSNFSGNSVSLFPGNGNGSFGNKTDYIVGNGPVGLAAADFNQDGYMDLAVANNGGFQTGTTVSILTNNSAGGFLPAVTISGVPMPYKLQAGLIDGDNLPDIVVANEQESITILHNTGSGFTNTTYSMQGTQINNLYASIQLADIDNDQDLDVFYSSFGTQQISLRKNLGNGLLDSIQLIVLDFWYGGAASFEIVDLNNDSLKDIVASASLGRTGDGYRYVLNLGNGNFGPEKLGTAGQYTFVVMTGDVDMDGDIDILTADNYSNELTIHPNDGSGNFPVPPLYTSGIPSYSNKLEAGDVDNDGDLDIATSANSRTAVNTPVSVTLNNGNGAFATAITYSSGSQGGVGVKLRDINNDGFQDLIWASGINTTPYDFFTAINTGNGTFAAPHRWSMNSCGWNDLDAADLDNDGDIDVVITEWLGCLSVPLSGRRIYICYNDGTGNFSTPNIKIVNPFPGPLAICDFNEDGFLDLATGQSADIDISLNDSTGDFQAPVSFPMSQSPFDILATDLNNDGHVDLASCNYGSNPGDYNLTVRLGNGNGTFQNVELIDAAYSPDLANVSGICAGDIDNDNDIDLMVSQNASNDMSIYLNNGSGVFSYDHRICSYYGFSSPWYADFTGDGKSDLAGLVDLLPSGTTSGLTILGGLNTGNATGGSGLSACNSNVPTAIFNPIEKANMEIQITPNPVNESSNITFQMPVSGKCELNIYNSLGQITRETETVNLNSGIQNILISRRDLTAGVYHVQLTMPGQILSKRFVISNFCNK